MSSDPRQPEKMAQPEKAGPAAAQPDKDKQTAEVQPQQPERGGPKGPEPTRYGDWENNGRCTDF